MYGSVVWETVCLLQAVEGLVVLPEGEGEHESSSCDGVTIATAGDKGMLAPTHTVGPPGIAIEAYTYCSSRATQYSSTIAVVINWFFLLYCRQA